MKKKMFFKNVSGRKSSAMVILCILLFIIALPGNADNPLVTSVYTADPAGFVANGRLYVICSHDKAGATDYNQLFDYILLSSADLATWQNHGVVFDARTDTSWANLAYAPDMAVKNGKYYLYFPDGGDSIGVAVGNSPEGPFSDPIGRSLVNKNMPNCNVQWCFDPGIFVDDNGQAYLYFGGGGPGNARVIRLNSDMTSVNGDAVTIDAPNFFEAAYMHKRNGTYYFSYSTTSDAGMRIDYMTSSNPMSGFQYRGTILDNPWDNLNNNNHHSIVEYEGQWYIFYHNRTLSNSVYQRSVCLDYLYYNSDGTIQRVNATREGVDPVTSTSSPTPEPTPTPTHDPNANITVRARGTMGGEILELHIDGNIVATWTMTTSYEDYYASGSGSTIEVHFTNDDELENGMDIQVDYLIYNNTTYQAEDQEVNTGVYIDGSCGGSYSEMLQCNGYIRFTMEDPGNLGDVNSDGTIDIVDALLIAQFYVGLNPSNFDQNNADTNCDGSIDIVDALLVAQYYVGLISDFC
jgi:hypothetical protein